MRALLTLVLVLVALLGYGQTVGGAGWCKTSANPNTITSLRVVNQKNMCSNVWDTLARKMYYYDYALTVGSRWVEFIPLTPPIGAETVVTAGTGIAVTGIGSSGSPYVVTNTGDLSPTNEIQHVDTLRYTTDSLFISLYLDGRPQKKVYIPQSPGGIYGPSDTTTGNHIATIAAGKTLTFRSQGDNSGGVVPFRIESNGSEPDIAGFYANGDSLLISRSDTEFLIHSSAGITIMADGVLSLQGDSILLNAVGPALSTEKTFLQITPGGFVKYTEGVSLSQTNLIAGANITFAGDTIKATGGGGADSLWVKQGGTFGGDTLDNVRRSGKISVGTQDTTGLINIAAPTGTPFFFFKHPSPATLLNANYMRFQNPGGVAYPEFWFSQRSAYNNAATYGITDAIDNSVYRIGYNATAAQATLGGPSLFDSWEPHWWGTSGFDGSPRLHFERHWQMLDSAGVEHRPITGYYEKRANGYGTTAFNNSFLDVRGWTGGQNAKFAVNRDSEVRYGTAQIFGDSLRALNLSNIADNTALFLSSADRSSGDVTGKGTALVFGGLGTRGARSAIFGRYNDSNSQNGLDITISTQATSSGAQVERITIKSGDSATKIGVNTTAPQQTFHVSGTTLLAGGTRINMVGDSAALKLRYASTQTTPVFSVYQNNGDDAFSAHRYQSSNPSLLFGSWGTFAGTPQGNTVFGLTSAAFDNTTGGGENNTLVGYLAGNPITTGYQNTVLGARSGSSISDGYQNTFFGYLAGTSNTSGYQNTFIGRQAGQFTTSGAVNLGLGTNALRAVTTGYGNVAIGSQAGEATTGVENLYMGYGSGRTNTGSGNVFLGAYSGENTSGSNKLIIDNSNTATPLLYGDFSSDRIGINNASPSEALHVVGNIRADGTVMARGTASSAIVKILNTTASTGRQWDLISDDDGDFLVSQSAIGVSISVSGTTGDVNIADQLSLSTLGSTPTSILGLNAGNFVSGITVGSGLSLSGGTLSVTGGTSNYQTLRDDGTGMTQRAAANFVSTSTVTMALTDDAGGGETEIRATVPTDGITATEIATGAVGPTELAPTTVTAGTYGSATQVPVTTFDADGRATGVTNTTITGILSGLTATRIPFATAANALTDDALLTWNNTTKRMSIGNTGGSPQAAIHVAEGSVASFEAFRAAATVSGNMLFTLTNANNAGGASNNILTQNVGGSAGGDPLHQYVVGGVGTWVEGVDNSNADKFIIGYESTPGSGSDWLTISTTGQVGIQNNAPAHALDVTGRMTATLYQGKVGTPTHTFGTGAGTSGTPVLNSLTGTSNGIDVQFTTGTTPSINANIISITYPTAFTTTTNPVFCASNAQTATDITKFYVSAATATAFTLTANGTLSASTTYRLRINISGR